MGCSEMRTNCALGHKSVLIDQIELSMLIIKVLELTGTGAVLPNTEGMV